MHSFELFLCLVQGAESAGLELAVLSSVVQPGWDIRERALLTLKALLQAEEGNVQVFNSLGASIKLQSLGSWAEIQDTGYREELHQLHAFVLSLLASSPRHAPSDEL